MQNAYKKRKQGEQRWGMKKRKIHGSCPKDVEWTGDLGGCPASIHDITLVVSFFAMIGEKWEALNQGGGRFADMHVENEGPL